MYVHFIENVSREHDMSLVTHSHTHTHYICILLHCICYFIHSWYHISISHRATHKHPFSVYDNEQYLKLNAAK